MLAIQKAAACSSRSVVSKQSSETSKACRGLGSIHNGLKCSVGEGLLREQVRCFHVSSIVEAVPKKKQSYSRVRVRTHSQNWQINVSDFSHAQPCSHCGKTILRHNVCNHCGWFKGVPIFLRAINRHSLKLSKASTQSPSSSSSQPSPPL